jgi:hypothetical protein
MPALPPVAQVLKFVWHWTVDGDPLAQTIGHWHYSGGPPTPTDCNVMGSNATSLSDSVFAAVCHNTVGVAKCQVTDLTSPTSAQGEGGSPWLGTESGSLLPPAASAIANYTIARRYRGGKPRNYFPLGVSGDLASTGLWSGTAITNFETAIVNFLAAMLTGVASGCTIDRHVNVSYFHGSTVVISPTTGRARNVPTLRGTPVVDTITGSSVASFVGSQRRRNRDA